MILLPQILAPLAFHLALLATITSSAGPVAVSDTRKTIPVVEVVKVFGKLAGSECYGRKSPPGSSCQITRREFEKSFHLMDGGGREGGGAFTK